MKKLLASMALGAVLAGAALSGAAPASAGYPCPPGIPDLGDGCTASDGDHVWQCVTNIFMTCGVGAGIWHKAPDGSWYHG